MTPTSRRPCRKPVFVLMLLLAVVPRTAEGTAVEEAAADKGGDADDDKDLLMSARDPFEVAAAEGTKAAEKPEDEGDQKKAASTGDSVEKSDHVEENADPTEAEAAEGADAVRKAKDEEEKEPHLSFSEAVHGSPGGAPSGRATTSSSAAARAALGPVSDSADEPPTAPAADKSVVKEKWWDKEEKELRAAEEKDDGESKGKPSEETSKPEKLEQNSAALAAAGAAAAAATVPGSSAWLHDVTEGDETIAPNNTCARYGCGSFVHGRKCQCNDKCAGFQNCCADFDNTCIKAGRVNRCFYSDIAFSPLDMPGTYGVVTANASACQEHCRRHMGCVFVTFWSGLCHIAAASAELIDVHGTGAIVGPADCDDPTAPKLPRPAAPTITMPPGVDARAIEAPVPCATEGVLYIPELPGIVPVKVETQTECQRKCAQTSGCGHFSLSYDKWCRLSPLDAEAVKDPSLGFAGPRSCGMEVVAPDGSRLFASDDTASAGFVAGLPLWRHADVLLALGAACTAVLGARLVLVLRTTPQPDCAEAHRGLLSPSVTSRRGISRGRWQPSTSAAWSRIGGNRLSTGFERCATADDGEDVEMLQDEEEILQDARFCDAFAARDARIRFFQGFGRAAALRIPSACV
eukprot:CAMPEP_0170228662 /NCGR_PEP_ID=MMETSP0116_2-20130129/14051_1 /TAXON_ID=400756 /ORGANISM="Durinskia baltica, Strain CSIRO CS-38" /LENGTH=632 /DNA_ID=CAMNT_0010479405 /DNA_START=66 /DNA_END=1962 /DNA_ORIENTATION=-